LKTYADSLLASALPFGMWGAVVIWAGLFAANQWVARLTRAANDAQHSIDVDDWSRLRRGFEPRSIVSQIVFGALVLAIAQWLGGPAFVFLAGGLIVSKGCGLAMNAQGLWAARAMAHVDAARGRLTFTTSSAFRHMGHRLGAAALSCMLAGAVVANLALWGGALFLAVTAGGCFNRARDLSARV
jgi:hypothetical protein